MNYLPAYHARAGEIFRPTFILRRRPQHRAVLQPVGVRLPPEAAQAVARLAQRAHHAGAQVRRAQEDRRPPLRPPRGRRVRLPARDRRRAAVRRGQSRLVRVLLLLRRPRLQFCTLRPAVKEPAGLSPSLISEGDARPRRAISPTKNIRPKGEREREKRATLIKRPPRPQQPLATALRFICIFREREGGRPSAKWQLAKQQQSGLEGLSFSLVQHYSSCTTATYNLRRRPLMPFNLTHPHAKSLIDGLARRGASLCEIIGDAPPLSSSSFACNPFPSEVSAFAAAAVEPGKN